MTSLHAFLILGSNTKQYSNPEESQNCTALAAVLWPFEPHQHFVRAQLPTSACIFFLCILSQVLCVRHNQIYFHHSFRQHIPDHNHSLYNKVRLHITFYQSPLTRLMNLPLKAVFQYLLCPSPLLF